MAANITDDEDFLELIEVLQQPQRRQRTFRHRENHFQKWNDEDFIKRFRLSKDGVRFLINEVYDLLVQPTNLNHALTPTEMILLTLRFYATGSFLLVTGDFIGIDKGTASRHIWKVSRVFANLHNRFIKMPSAPEEMRTASQGFYNISRLPKCLGALDCTHVKILSPGGNEAEVYRNRKGFFSFNVQGICDSQLLFQDVVCRWPGATHDSQIFWNSLIRAKFERGDFPGYFLVADSGYAVRPFVIPPLDETNTAAEYLFNEAQIRTRNPIERTFGIWKRRFPILSFGIRLKKEKVESIVIATAVLHNIARILNEREPPLTREEEIAIELVNNVPLPGYILQQNERRHRAVNERTRRQLINYFNTLI